MLRPEVSLARKLRRDSVTPALHAPSMAATNALSPVVIIGPRIAPTRSLGRGCWGEVAGFGTREVG